MDACLEQRYAVTLSSDFHSSGLRLCRNGAFQKFNKKKHSLDSSRYSGPTPGLLHDSGEGNRCIGRSIYLLAMGRGHTYCTVVGVRDVCYGSFDCSDALGSVLWWYRCCLQVDSVDE